MKISENSAQNLSTICQPSSIQYFFWEGWCDSTSCSNIYGLLFPVKHLFIPHVLIFHCLGMSPFFFSNPLHWIGKWGAILVWRLTSVSAGILHSLIIFSPPFPQWSVPLLPPRNSYLVGFRTFGLNLLSFSFHFLSVYCLLPDAVS